MNSNSYFLKISFLIFAFLLGCHKKQNEDLQLDFTHIENFEEAYSLLFTGNDTVLIRQYWTANVPSGSSRNYMAVLEDPQRNQLIKLIKEINIAALDTIYPKANRLDGSFMGLFLKNDLQKITTFPIHRKQPGEVRNLVEYITSLKKILKLKSADFQVDFKSAPRIPKTVDKVRTSEWLPSE